MIPSLQFLCSLIHPFRSGDVSLAFQSNNLTALPENRKIGIVLTNTCQGNFVYTFIYGTQADIT